MQVYFIIFKVIFCFRIIKINLMFIDLQTFRNMVQRSSNRYQEKISPEENLPRKNLSRKNLPGRNRPGKLLRGKIPLRKKFPLEIIPLGKNPHPLNFFPFKFCDFLSCFLAVFSWWWGREWVVRRLKLTLFKPIYFAVRESKLSQLGT